MSIKFVDDLPGKAPRKWAEVAAQLRERPGQWAEVHRSEQYSTSQSPVTALGRFADIETARRTIDGEVVVFARAVAR